MVLTHVDVEKALEVFRRVGHGVSSIREEDASISVVDVGVFKLLSRGSVHLDTLSSNCLPGSKGISTSLDGVGRSNKLRHLLSVLRSEFGVSSCLHPRSTRQC